MPRLHPFRQILALCVVVAFAAPAYAQQQTNAYCDNLKAELAAVEQSIATASDVSFAAHFAGAGEEIKGRRKSEQPIDLA